MMPITDNIRVVVQAHLLPFHNYKSYRYVRPNAKNAMPIPTKKKYRTTGKNIISPIPVSSGILLQPGKGIEETSAD